MDTNNTQAAVDAGIRIGQQQLTIQRANGNVPYVVAHKDTQVTLCDVLLKTEEARAERPTSLLGTATLLTEASLVAHIKRFKDQHSVLFANTDPENPQLLAAYDYHQPALTPIAETDILANLSLVYAARPRWMRHKALYIPKLSREWQSWVASAGVALTQAAFADFLDEHDQDVAGPMDGRNVPTQADLATLGHTLKVTSEDVVEATIDRTTGNYSIVAKQNMTPTGECKIWKEFDILIPVFEGGAKVRIPCKFRLQKSSGQIKFGWVVPTADRILRTEYVALAERIAKDAEIPLMFGSPEK